MVWAWKQLSIFLEVYSAFEVHSIPLAKKRLFSLLQAIRIIRVPSAEVQQLQRDKIIGKDGWMHKWMRTPPHNILRSNLGKHKTGNHIIMMIRYCNEQTWVGFV